MSKQSVKKMVLRERLRWGRDEARESEKYWLAHYRKSFSHPEARLFIGGSAIFVVECVATKKSSALPMARAFIRALREHEQLEKLRLYPPLAELLATPLTAAADTKDPK